MNSRKPRVAVLGASGIGRIHVREFAKTGSDVVAVLGSRPDSAKQTVDQLNQEFQLSIQPFSDYNEILKLNLDAVSVATPWEMHFDQLQKAIENGLMVFCEKPLFWNDGITTREIQERLDYLLTAGKGKLAVNTCNAYFLDQYKELFGFPETVQTFEFVFHTNGKNHNERIGIDLLPHGLSLLLKLSPQGQITNITKEFSEKNYNCSFEYSNIQCRFTFQQDSQGEKKLEFDINGLKTTRVASVVDGQYQVGLRREDQSDQISKVQDPFYVFINDFVEKCETKEEFLCGAEIATSNVSLMSQILFA